MPLMALALIAVIRLSMHGPQMPPKRAVIEDDDLVVPTIVRRGRGRMRGVDAGGSAVDAGTDGDR